MEGSPFVDLGLQPLDTPITLVAKMIVFDPVEGHLMETVPRKQRFIFDGCLSFGHESYTLLDVQLVNMYPHPVVSLGNQGRLMYHDPPTGESLYHVTELCAGMGCLGMGALACGFHPLIAIDHNKKFLDVYGQHSSVKLIEGCIGSNDVIFETWSFQKTPTPISAGIACQPYSRLGDEFSGADPRSKTLPQTLRFGFLTRAPAIILECVAPAKDDAFVQSELRQFCAITGYSMSQCLLQLSEVWASSRPRWWCILLAPDFGSLTLQPFPALPEVSKVEHVIPLFTPWKDHDERLLQLNSIEADAFGVHSGAIHRYILNVKQRAPCALHAWGSQLGPCPCGCRPCGLSPHRLESKGVHGVVIPMACSGDGFGFRHIHPNECLALQGVDPCIDYGDDLKLTLSAAGQCASPLQSCWIFAQLRSHFVALKGLTEVTPPLFHLQALRSWVIARCTKVWPLCDSLFQDAKFRSLVAFWKPIEGLSLDQLLDRSRWHDVLDSNPGIGHILDHLIRTAQVDLPVEVTTIVVDDPETPCFDASLVLPSSGLTAVHSSVGRDFCEVPCTDSAADSCTVGEFDPCTYSPTPCLTMLQHHQCSCPGPLPVIADSIPLGCCAVLWIDGPCEVRYVDVCTICNVDALVNAECALLSRSISHVTDDSGVPCALKDSVLPGQVIVLWPRDVEGSFHASLPKGVSSEHVDEWCVSPQVPAVQLLDRPVCDGKASFHDARANAFMIPVEQHWDKHVPACAIAPAVESPTAPWSRYPDADVTNGDAFDVTMQYRPDLIISNASPVMCLTEPQLLQLRVPDISTECHWVALQGQLLTSAGRAKILENQPSICADDEIRFHLQELVLGHNRQIVPGCGQKFVMSIDPLLMSAWIDTQPNFCVQFLSQLRAPMTDGATLLTILNLSGHWIPLKFVCHETQLQIVTWDVTESYLQPLFSLFRVVQHAVGCSEFKVFHNPRAFSAESHCGALALAFVSHVLLGTPFHARLRTRFAMHLAALQMCPRPWSWGAGGNDTTKGALSSLLVEHGVPAELADARAALALKTLGIGAVEIALKHKSPWKQLKTVGNQHRFQFLLPSELQALIEKNNQASVGKKGKTAKQPRRRAPEEPVTLDPSKLSILDGSFRCGAQVIPQIRLCQIGPATTGVALVSVQDAAPYLRSNARVSTEPLALLVLGDVSQMQCTLCQLQVVVPCTCVANNEPLLIDATMFQLGSKEVVKHAAVNPITLPTVESCVIRFFIFRDEIDVEWKEFCRAPIRWLVSKVPLLRMCNHMDCGCPAWHNAENLPIQDPVLDLWRRQFMKFGFNPSSPQDADMYAASVRLPVSLGEPIIRASGGGGIYGEPRSLDGKFVSPDFSVIWAPKLGKAELEHIRQTHPSALGLARLGDRRGIRCSAHDAGSAQGHSTRYNVLAFWSSLAILGWALSIWIFQTGHQ